MSSIYLRVISLGSKQMWLGHLIASPGCLCSHKLIKQKCIRYTVIDLCDMILSKIDWCLFSADVVDWFVRSLSVSSRRKVSEVLSITKQVSPEPHPVFSKHDTCLWNSFTFLIWPLRHVQCGSVWCLHRGRGPPGQVSPSLVHRHKQPCNHWVYYSFNN